MRVFELGRYNIPDEIIEAWISQIGEELFPVQERAIKRYGVLDGKSLIISSPTTSGKTFVGEIAAIKSVTQLISRLRSELRDYTIKRDGSIIENDGSGYYRLSVPPDNVIIDKESLSRHWSRVVRELVEKTELISM